MATNKTSPTFVQLLLANLRVVMIALLVAVVAFGLWRGVAALFPEVAWLQVGS